MAVPLKLLRKFKRVAKVIDERNSARDACSELTRKNDELEASRVALLVERGNLLRERGDVLRDHDLLAHRHELLARDHGATVDVQASLTQERDRLSHERSDLIGERDALQALLSDRSSQRWQVKTAAGIRMLLDSDSLVDKHILSYDRWEGDCIDFLINVTKKIRVAYDQDIYFFDIGAYIGQYALAMKHEFPDIDVLAFEANPYNFIQLRANLLLNDYVEHIETYNCCVTDRTGRTKVSRPKRENRGGAKVGSAGDDDSPLAVENLVLDERFAFLSDAIIIFKIDVEGFEPRVLGGLRSLVARNKVVLQIEDWEFPDGEIGQMLGELGFALIRNAHPDFHYANFDLAGLGFEVVR